MPYEWAMWTTRASHACFALLGETLSTGLSPKLVYDQGGATETLFFLCSSSLHPLCTAPIERGTHGDNCAYVGCLCGK